MSSGNPFDIPEMRIFQQMAQALIQYTPEHFTNPYCIVEQAPSQLPGRLKYTIGCNEFPEEGTSRPSAELHEACYQLFKSWTKGNEPFPRTELRMSQSPDGKWKTNLERKDEAPPPSPPNPKDPDGFWQAVYAARQKSFELRFGPFPAEIQKLMNMMAIWPGGGLIQMDAPRIGGRGVCTTFGLTNPDMPSQIRAKAGQVKSSVTLEGRTPRYIHPDWAGYGYEIMVVTPQPVTWPLLALSWFAQMEVLNDLDLPGRVDESGGVTVESLKIGDGTRMCDFLVQPAAEPYPPGFTLPNGKMRLFIATWITRDEMNFALEKGRPVLLEKLMASKVGQVSVLDRPSILT